MPAEVVAWLTAIWLTVLGAAVGSFLNVVIHRLPRGENLATPPSHCPACQRPIRWHDNIPVLSWLMLRGRCRDCGRPISIRYPIVEAVTAISFLTLAVLECSLGGVNLPARPLDTHVLPGGGLIVVDGRSGQLLYGIFLYHQALLCALLVAGMIQIDGHRVPKSVFLPPLVLGALMPILWPGVHPVAAIPGLSGTGDALAGLIDTACGAVAGAVLGALISRLEPPRRRRGLFTSLVVLGIVLGWQATVYLSVALGAWLFGRRLLERAFARIDRLSGVLVLFAFALAWIVAWAPLATWLP